MIDIILYAICIIYICPLVYQCLPLATWGLLMLRVKRMNLAWIAFSSTVRARLLLLPAGGAVVVVDGATVDCAWDGAWDGTGEGGDTSSESSSACPLAVLPPCPAGAAGAPAGCTAGGAAGCAFGGAVGGAAGGALATVGVAPAAAVGVI